MGPPVPARILDCGCGEGALTRTLKRTFPAAEVHGCDVSAVHLQRARAVGLAVEYRCMTEALPYADAEFDVVLVLDVLEHVDRPDMLLRDVARVLRGGGRLLLHCPCEGQPLMLHWLAWKLRIGHNLKRDLIGHIQRFTHRQVLALAAGAGLRCTMVRYQYHLIGQITDFLVFYKKWCRRKDESGRASWFEKALANAPTWRLVALLESLSYFESRLFARLPAAMGIDAVFEKQ